MLLRYWPTMVGWFAGTLFCAERNGGERTALASKVNLFPPLLVTAFSTMPSALY